MELVKIMRIMEINYDKVKNVYDIDKMNGDK